MGEFVFADQFVLESGKTREFFLGFLKGLVHKSNNLVGVVQGFGSLVLLEDDLTEGTRENIEQMDSAARSMSELNKKVLTAGGCANVVCTDANISEMADYLQTKAEAAAAANGVQLSFSTAGGLSPVSIDGSRFHEVFGELINNAAEGAGESEAKAVSVSFQPGENGGVDLLIKNSLASSEMVPKMEEMFDFFHSTKGNDHIGIGLITAAVLCGQMSIRLALKNDGTDMTTWLQIPKA